MNFSFKICNNRKKASWLDSSRPRLWECIGPDMLIAFGVSLLSASLSCTHDHYPHPHCLSTLHYLGLGYPDRNIGFLDILKGF